MCWSTHLASRWHGWPPSSPLGLRGEAYMEGEELLLQHILVWKLKSLATICSVNINNTSLNVFANGCGVVLLLLHGAWKSSSGVKQVHRYWHCASCMCFLSFGMT